MAKQSLHSLKKAKQENRRFATITAYDATFARLADQASIECVLVGDSLGNVIQGRRSTVPVTMDEMVYHTSIVDNGRENFFLMSDMPFMSYATPEQAIANATDLMQAGAQMVKLEGAEWLTDTIAYMSDRGIPICGHLGLLPQSVDKTGGYRFQGKDPESADRIVANAQDYAQAGADIILLECVPAELAKRVTKSVEVPVIGIGAGAHTDSQVLVMHDMLGISPHIPSFVKNYMEGSVSLLNALQTYGDEVRSGTFPAKQHCLA